MPLTDSTFEKLKDYLESLTAMFILVYRPKAGSIDTQSEWYKADFRGKYEQGDPVRLSARYQQVALASYQQRRNFIMPESIPSPNARGRNWYGFFSPEQPQFCPPDARGRLTFHIVVGAGPTHDAGHVIVTKLLAKEIEEAKAYIAKIQEIVRGSTDARKTTRPLFCA